VVCERGRHCKGGQGGKPIAAADEKIGKNVSPCCWATRQLLFSKIADQSYNGGGEKFCVCGGTLRKSQTCEWKNGWVANMAGQPQDQGGRGEPRGGDVKGHERKKLCMIGVQEDTKKILRGNGGGRKEGETKLKWETGPPAQQTDRPLSSAPEGQKKKSTTCQSNLKKKSDPRRGGGKKEY